MVALDFPDTPTVGQVFDKWTWNGTQWVLTAGSASGPRTMGYAQVTASQAGFSSLADLTGLSVTFNVVAGHRYRITGSAQVSASGNNVNVILNLQINSGSVQQTKETVPFSNNAEYASLTYVLVAATTQSVTAKLQLMSGGGGTAGILADPTYPAFILAEDIT